MKQTNFAKGLALSVGVLVLSASLSFLAFAWTAPASTPPNGNVVAPVNTGSATQTKSGGLNVSGNMGIGTSGSGYKLRVTGQSNFSQDGTSQCCSNDGFTISLAENTQGTGKKAGIQFHNSGVAEGQLRLDAGINGRELKAYSYQTNMDLHATGYVQGDDGLCIGNDCITGWSSLGGFWTKSGNNIYNNNSGNVGVGTSSPAAKLDVRGTIATGGALELTQQATGNRYSYIDFHGDDTYTDYSLRMIRYNTGANAESRIEHRGSGILRIYTRDSGSNIVLQPYNNVGVGTSSPGYKLDINGSLGVRSTADFITSAGGNRTVRFGYENSRNYARILAYGSGASPANRLLIDNVANGSNAAGGYIDFRPDGNYMLLYPSGGSSGFLRLYAGGGERIRINANGNVGIGTASPAAKLDVAGQIKISGGSPAAGKVLTSNSSGLATWETPSGGITDRDCGEDGWVQGIVNGQVVCGSGENPAMPKGCTEALPAGNKRIFVTSTTYQGIALTNNKRITSLTSSDIQSIDQKCQSIAEAANLPGTYKALLMVKNSSTTLREPFSVLKTSNSFWNGEAKDNGKCEWHLVAQNPADFFASKSGQYLSVPIKYNESGQATNLTVWTNFKADGSGGYTYPYLLNSYGFCYVSTSISNYRTKHVYGLSTKTDTTWSNNLFDTGSASQYNSSAPQACYNAMRALYCVEQ